MKFVFEVIIKSDSYKYFGPERYGYFSTHEKAKEGCARVIERIIKTEKQVSLRCRDWIKIALMEHYLKEDKYEFYENENDAPEDDFPIIISHKLDV